MTVSLPNESLSRRQLLKALGGGILVLTTVPLAFGIESNFGGQGATQNLAAWVHIAESGAITVFTGKVEVGQNARTNVTQAAAEELRVPYGSVTVVMGDTDLVPYDMGTFGSLTTPRMLPLVRRAAAAALDFLLDIAAQRSGLDKKSLRAADGHITGQGFSMSYGALAKGQSLDRTISGDLELTPAKDWRVMGRSVPKIGIEEFVTGRHKYASDMSAPRMLHAKVLRPPSFGATLAAFDSKAAEAMPGVQVIHDEDFAAVVAPTVRQAVAALKAINASWNEKPQPGRQELFEQIRGTAESPTVAAGEKSLQGTYRCEFIAHVPLEPRAAFADWDGAKMTVYTGTQRPFAVKDEVVAATKLMPGQVRVIVPDTGAGYGGKHSGDAAVEAARIAKAIGKPVKLVWTREEEFTWAYFRPAGVSEISSGFDSSGKITAWTHDNYNSGPSAVETPYDIEGNRCQFHRADSPLRQGSYRSLAACFNNFARETHMDEIAHALGQDPLALRLANLSDPRLRAVLMAAADKFGWPGTPRAGHGCGIACGTEKSGYIATAVELSVEGKEVKLLRAVTAYECGAVVNPDLLKNQVVGALIMGIGGALFEQIDFAGGKIATNHLAYYRVPRFSDIPAIECVLVDRPDLPSAGAGETPIMGIAPAIGNAIFRATGTRLRNMPLTL